MKVFVRNLELALLSQAWQPQHLHADEVHDSQCLTEQILSEAIALRDAGKARLSLELIEAAQRVGVDSPWLLDNQARAHVMLGERQVAWQIWQQLLTHDDNNLAQTAGTMAELQEATLLNGLASLCAREGWMPRHLHDPRAGWLLERVLKEIVTARESQAPRLSLDLAEETLSQGWHDPWLLDNQARALVHLQREDEALPIWEGLQRHHNVNIVSTATEMVALYRRQVEEKRLLESVEQFHQQGDLESAQQLLVEALAQDPTSVGLRQRLNHLLHKGSDDLLGVALDEHAAALEVHQHLLAALEHQLNQRGGG